MSFESTEKLKKSLSFMSNPEIETEWRNLKEGGYNAYVEEIKPTLHKQNNIATLKLRRNMS